jgi:hypothetical protein
MREAIWSGWKRLLEAGAVLVVLCGAGVLAAAAQAVKVENSAAQASFVRSGEYQVKSREAHWVLVGKLGAKPESIRRRSGSDGLGAWQEVDARTKAEVAGIRVYEDAPVVLFREKRLTEGKNEDVFPEFAALPAGLMEFSYGVRTFAPYEFGQLGGEGPWVLFDRQRQTMVLSPADHFLVADMTNGPGGVKAGGLDAKITTLPKGFEHETLLVLGKGITSTLDAWGSALQQMNGKQPIANDADVVLNQFGYWTDHYAYYYYKFDKKLGYEGTLLAVRNKYKELGVPLKYMQLDSWWYPKGKGFSADGEPANGETVYRADKTIFPKGLKAFHAQMGVPFVVHARWVAPDSPYRHEYKMSRNVILSPKFWRKTAKYLHDGGVTVYEQDWLDENARPAINLTDPQEFLGNMAHAMAAEGLAIQYCMPLPGYYMASTRYQNVETIRVSDDGFTRKRWDDFLYDSTLAHAVGLWPWSDVYFSKELPEVILDTLSGGPVGVGDPIDGIDAGNLKATMRADSVLLKPDVPVRPVDAMYLSDASNLNAPMVAATHSGEEVEVFAYPRGKVDQRVTVSLKEIGVIGPAYAWDWVRHTGRLIAAGGSFPMLFENGWAYEVVTPVGKDGIGLLGDSSKIVPLAAKRFPTVTNGVTNAGNTHVTVTFAAGEATVTVTGYAEKRPEVRAERGSSGPVEYDGATQLFRVAVHPARGGHAAELVIE